MTELYSKGTIIAKRQVRKFHTANGNKGMADDIIV
jgi:hypothetical protein